MQIMFYLYVCFSVLYPYEEAVLSWLGCTSTPILKVSKETTLTFVYTVNTLEFVDTKFVVFSCMLN